MRCKEIQRELTAYIYDEITRDREEIEGHLEGCRRCQRVLEEMRETLGLVDQRVVHRPSVWFWSGYLTKVHQRLKREVSPSRGIIGWRPVFLRPVPVLAAACLILILILSGRILFFIPLRPNVEMTAIAQDLEVFENLELLENLDSILEIEPRGRMGE